jgi:hypothetical protein
MTSPVTHDLSAPTHDPADSDPTASAIPTEATEPTRTHLEVVSWSDPFLAQHGYDPRSAYVERFWLGVLGPSAVWLLRRFARGLEEHPEGFRINLADTARALGLGEGTSRNSMVVRTVDRICQFGVAQLHGRDRIAVRSHVAPLNARQLKRLPIAVQRAHDQWVAGPVDAEQRRRALTIAVGLLERGQDPWSVEHHLAGYGFPDQLSYEAIRDAMDLCRRRQSPPPTAA